MNGRIASWWKYLLASKISRLGSSHGYRRGKTVGFENNLAFVVHKEFFFGGGVFLSQNRAGCLCVFVGGV